MKTLLSKIDSLVQAHETAQANGRELITPESAAIFGLPAGLLMEKPSDAEWQRESLQFHEWQTRTEPAHSALLKKGINPNDVRNRHLVRAQFAEMGLVGYGTNWPEHKQLLAENFAAAVAVAPDFKPSPETLKAAALDSTSQTRVIKREISR